MSSIERQQGIDRRFAGTFSNDVIVGAAAGDFCSRRSPEKLDEAICAQCDHRGGAHEVAFDKRPRICSGESVWRGKSSQDCVRLDQCGRWSAQLLSTIESPVDFYGSFGVMLVP